MKKLTSLLTLCAVMSAVLTASAVEFKNYSFMNPQVSSLVVSNGIRGWTNLQSSGLTTNRTGALTLWTNYQGTQFASGTNTALDSMNMLGSVPLWGTGLPWLTGATNGVFNVSAADYSMAKITVKLTGSSGANAAVNFRFAALPNGVDEATDLTWTFPVVAVTNSTITVSTNLPYHRFAGCKALRLVSIDNADTDASSGVWVHKVEINGWSP